MSNIVYLYFNGRGLHVPQSGDWHEYQASSDAKLALLCYNTWKYYGWDVRLMRDQTRGTFDGKLLDDGYEYNEFLPTLRHTMMSDGIYAAWFTTFDVLNTGLSTACERIRSWKRFDMLCPNEHFTLAVGGVNLNALNRMISLLTKYDRGEYGSERPTSMVCDESVLRMIVDRDQQFGTAELRKYISFRNIMRFAHQPWHRKPLVHYSRSSIHDFATRLAESPHV